MSQLYKSEFAIADNVMVIMNYLLKKGEEMSGHAHVFDHITLLARGSVNMIHDHGSKEYQAPSLIITPKGIEHKFIALEDQCLLCCIHACRDGDGVDDVAPQDISTEKAMELFQKYPLLHIENTEAI